ncbi:MAG: cytochrome C [Nitrospinota bacterium]|nr:MAG: cytochrome C [Nitrospinota bacterium]
MKTILPFLIGFILAFGAVVAISQPWNPAVYQPIAFNHKKHAVEQDLPCNFCHEYVEEAYFAGLPSVEICLNCHDSPITDSPEEEKIRQHAQRGAEIRWKKVYRVPDHVYFSHRRHVTIAGIACTRCHGAIAESERPPVRPVIFPSMENCINCHRQRKVTTNCNACHK